MLRYQLENALRQTDGLTDQSTAVDRAREFANLAKQYRKLYFLDNLHILIKDAKDGVPEIEHRMTELQIQRNDELRVAEGAPMITSWDALYVARQRPGSDVTSSKASSSSGQPGPPPPAASAPGGPGATRPHPLPAPASDGDGAKRSRPPHAADRGPEASLFEECAEEVPSPHLPTAGTLIATAPKASPPANAEAPATPVSGGSPREPVQDAPSADAICEGEAVSVVTAKAMPLYRWTRYAPEQDRAPRFSAQRIITPAGSAPPHCPMPTRPAPMRISLAFEIDPTQEVDWTAARDQHDERLCSRCGTT